MHNEFTVCSQITNLIQPIGVVVDLERLQRTLENLYTTINHNPAEICFQHPHRQSSVNLTHPKNIPNDAVEQVGELNSKFFGPLAQGEKSLMKNYNISTADFTEMHELVKQSYVNDIVDQIQRYHSDKFQTGQIRWVHIACLGPGAGFHMHVDRHCMMRYHVALKTNQRCIMLAGDSGVTKSVHIPSDGRVWMLEPNVLHNALNCADSDSIEDVRAHLIFSVYC